MVDRTLSEECCPPVSRRTLVPLRSKGLFPPSAKVIFPNVFPFPGGIRFFSRCRLSKESLSYRDIPIALVSSSDISPIFLKKRSNSPLQRLGSEFLPQEQIAFFPFSQAGSLSSGQFGPDFSFPAFSPPPSGISPSSPKILWWDFEKRQSSPSAGGDNLFFIRFLGVLFPAERAHVSPISGA